MSIRQGRLPPKSNDLTNTKTQGQDSSITNLIIYFKFTNIKIYIQFRCIG
jgi:hypothetical protein